MNGRGLMLAAVACAGMMLIGCPRQDVRPIPSKRRPEVLSIMRQRAETLRTLSAKLSIKVKMGSMKRAEKLSANFAARGPACLRLRAEHPLLDRKPLDMGCDGVTWWVHVRYQDVNRVDYGKLSDLKCTRTEAVPIRPDQIVALLGMAPIRDRSPDAHWVFTVHPGYYLLQEVVRADGTKYVATRIELDGDTNQIRRYETLLPSGRTDMSATLHDYRTVGDVPVPRRISIRFTRGKDQGTLDLEFKKVKVNPKLPSKVFKPLRFDEIPCRVRHPRDLALKSASFRRG